MRSRVLQGEAQRRGCRSFLVEEAYLPVNLPFVSKKLVSFLHTGTDLPPQEDFPQPFWEDRAPFCEDRGPFCEGPEPFCEGPEPFCEGPASFR